MSERDVISELLTRNNEFFIKTPLGKVRVIINAPQGWDVVGVQLDKEPSEKETPKTIKTCNVDLLI